MVISVATRVHSQKAEQALGLAQREIDRTRVLVERGNYTVVDLPPLAPGADQDAETALGANLTAAPTDYDHADPVDVNGDGDDDFLVQRYRVIGQEDGDGIPVAFAMGVRVYDIDVSGGGNLSTDPASLVMTSSDGGRGTQPLAVLYSTIATSDQGESLCNLNTYLRPNALPDQNEPSPTSGRLPDSCN
ncbi:MAG: hypothetical protein WBG32_18970 [Nodosilinea sp.]